MRLTLLSLLLTFVLIPLRADKLGGGDISLLPDYEKAGAIYKTQQGVVIPDLIAYSADVGMNVMRVRLFVDPSAYKGPDADPNACQSLDYILPLCKRIKSAGLQLMLDFHYSDTWADPAKQYTPAAWASLTNEELYDKIYEYTRETLLTLRENGVVPDFIQTGNEISYGMLWGPVGGTNLSAQKCYMNGSRKAWERFGKLLNRAGEACREVCPQARIVIHTERVAQVSVLRNFYTEMNTLGVDYDIIGLSYYPYFHGALSNLGSALEMLQSDFSGKPVMIVETGYSYKWEVPGSTYDFSATWSLSGAGQQKFMQDLITLTAAHDNVEGIIWWWMEYNAFNTKLSGWYNAPLFDSLTGKATPAFKTLATYAETSGVEIIPATEAGGDAAWYDIFGRRLPSAPSAKGIYVRKGEKVIIR